MKLNYLLIFLSGLVWCSCKKDIQVDNNDKNFPLELRVSTSNAATVFSWDEVKVTGFERYVLVRSAASIPAGANPFSNQVVFESTKFEDTTSEDNKFFIFDTIGYYRLYARVSGRWLESNEILVKTSSLVFDGIHQGSIFYPDSNWVIIMKTETFGSAIGKLVLFDLANNQTYASSTSFPIGSIEQIAMGVILNNNGSCELLAATSGNIRRFNLPELTQISQTVSTASPFSITPYRWNTILTTNGTSTMALNMRKESDLSAIRSHSRNNYFDHRTLGILDTNTNLVAEASASITALIGIDPVSGNLTPVKTVSELGNQVFLFQMPMSKDRQQFCPNTRGKIYDRQLNVIGDANPSPNNALVLDMTFSDQNNIVYVIMSDFFTGQTKINKVDTDESSILAEFAQPTNITFSRVGYLNKGLVVIASQFNNTTNPKFTAQLINF
jgi:hypothetical protein